MGWFSKKQAEEPLEPYDYSSEVVLTLQGLQAIQALTDVQSLLYYMQVDNEWAEGDPRLDAPGYAIEIITLLMASIGNVDVSAMAVMNEIQKAEEVEPEPVVFDQDEWPDEEVPGQQSLFLVREEWNDNEESEQ